MSRRLGALFGAAILVAFAFPFLELRFLTSTGTTPIGESVSGYGIVMGSAPYRLGLVLTGLIRTAAGVAVAATVAGAVIQAFASRPWVGGAATWTLDTAALIGLAAAARVSARDVGLGENVVFGGGHQVMTLGPGLWAALGLCVVATAWSLVAATLRVRRPVRG